MADPQKIPDTALPLNLMALLRTALMTAGAYFVGRGQMTDEELTAAVAGILTVVTLAWSQWATWRNARKAITAKKQAGY